MICSNGLIINETCICYPGYSGLDDFYDARGYDCQINNIIRLILISILIAFSSLNIVISSIKLQLWKFVQYIIMRKMITSAHYSFFLVFVHYGFVLLSSIIAIFYRVNYNIAGVITISLAIIFGCLNESNHLFNFLAIIVKGLPSRNTVGQGTKLKKIIIFVNITCGINWFIFSFLQYYDVLDQVYTIKLMWSSFSVATLSWAISIIFYGYKLINSISELHSNKSSFKMSEVIKTTNRIFIKKIKRMIYFLVIVSLSITISGCLIISFYEITSRITYIYYGSGSMLALTDLYYLIISSVPKQKQNYNLEMIVIRPEKVINQQINTLTISPTNKTLGISQAVSKDSIHIIKN